LKNILQHTNNFVHNWPLWISIIFKQPCLPNKSAYDDDSHFLNDCRILNLTINPSNMKTIQFNFNHPVKGNAVLLPANATGSPCPRMKVGSSKDHLL